MEFARTPGAKDKQPRKKRNLIAESSAVGAAGLAAANPMLKRQRGLLNREKQFQTREIIQKKNTKTGLTDRVMMNFLQSKKAVQVIENYRFQIEKK